MTEGDRGTVLMSLHFGTLEPSPCPPCHKIINETGKDLRDEKEN